VHFFDSGALQNFGFQANATFVNGDVKYDNAADPSLDQFALVGLSDSYNLMAFYEDDRFSARLLFNNRGEFLQNTAAFSGVPRYVDEYQQVDFTLGYRYNDNLTFSLEGINILEEPVIQYGRTRNQVHAYIEGDRRLMLGARYTFGD